MTKEEKKSILQDMLHKLQQNRKTTEERFYQGKINHHKKYSELSASDREIAQVQKQLAQL
jgi:polyhydroxyalkanoate synthesis regulator phasin